MCPKSSQKHTADAGPFYATCMLSAFAVLLHAFYPQTLPVWYECFQSTSVRRPESLFVSVTADSQDGMCDMFL